MPARPASIGARAKQAVHRRFIHPWQGPKSPFTAAIIERQVIFVHVPKAAGSSLKREIYGGPPTGGHRSIAEFAQFDPIRTRAYFKCAFVRNPWDRLLSAYSYLTQGAGANGGDRQFGRLITAQAPTFAEFIDRLGDSEFRVWVTAQQHFRAQSTWICLPDHAGHSMDFLGRYENMSADLTTLRTVLASAGSPQQLAGQELPPVVRSRDSRHLPYRDVYTERMRDVVADVYARDIALLDYSF